MSLLGLEKQALGFMLRAPSMEGTPSRHPTWFSVTPCRLELLAGAASGSWAGCVEGSVWLSVACRPSLRPQAGGEGKGDAVTSLPFCNKIVRTTTTLCLQPLAYPSQDSQEGHRTRTSHGPAAVRALHLLLPQEWAEVPVVSKGALGTAECPLPSPLGLARGAGRSPGMLPTARVFAHREVLAHPWDHTARALQPTGRRHARGQVATPDPQAKFQVCVMIHSGHLHPLVEASCNKCRCGV